MKVTLLEDLICPCGGELELTRGLESKSQDSQEIMSGWLGCGNCGEKFPIIRGVPRMLLGPLGATLPEEYPEFFAKFAGDAHAGAAAEPSAKVRTMRSFGYEWRHFSDFRPEGEANFRWYFAAYPPETLHGKALLDAGCGKGRHIFYAAQHARRSSAWT